jgi:hypothetical protein
MNAIPFIFPAARLTDLSQVNINYKINDAPMAINSFVAP